MISDIDLLSLLEVPNITAEDFKDIIQRYYSIEAPTAPCSPLPHSPTFHLTNSPYNNHIIPSTPFTNQNSPNPYIYQTFIPVVSHLVAQIPIEEGRNYEVTEIGNNDNRSYSLIPINKKTKKRTQRNIRWKTTRNGRYEGIERKFGKGKSIKQLHHVKGENIKLVKRTIKKYEYE